MFESTGWVLVEPSNDDTNKYDNICPTVVSWAPASTGKIESGIFESMDDSVEAAKVILHKKLKSPQLFNFILR